MVAAKFGMEVDEKRLSEPLVMKAAQVLVQKEQVEVCNIPGVNQTYSKDIYARFAVRTAHGDNMPILHHPYLANRFVTEPAVDKLYFDDGSIEGHEDFYEGFGEPPARRTLLNRGGLTNADVYLDMATA